MKKQIDVIEIDDLNDIDYSKCGSFYKLKNSSYHYFIDDNNSYIIVSEFFFNFIKKLTSNEEYNKDDKDYSDTLIKLSGKYNADDIIKFKNEGMI